MLQALARLFFVVDDNYSNSAGSITEPAPPSYEEALRLFVRQSAATLAPREPASRPEAAMGGGEDQGPPGDFELAMRLQSEEMGRRNTPPSARSNSLPRQQSAVSPRGPPVTNSARFSVVSAPGDLGQRPSAHYPIGPRPMQALQTIPEGMCTGSRDQHTILCSSIW